MNLFDVNQNFTLIYYENGFKMSRNPSIHGFWLLVDGITGHDMHAVFSSAYILNGIKLLVCFNWNRIQFHLFIQSLSAQYTAANGLIEWMCRQCTSLDLKSQLSVINRFEINGSYKYTICQHSTATHSHSSAWLFGMKKGNCC